MNPCDPLSNRPVLWRSTSSFSWLVMALVLCFPIVACTGNQSPVVPQQADVLRLLAVDEDRLLLVDPYGGEVEELAISPLLRDVSALAFDAENEVAYAIADASSAPRLLKITPGSGEVVEIGPIEMPPITAGTADAMVFDPVRNWLHIAAGGKGLSDYLISLDPQTGATTRMGRIRETPQGEFDGMALVRGEFYAIDFVSEETYVFKLTPRGALVTPLGKLPGKVTDIAEEPGSGRLFAALDGHLAILQVQGGEPYVVRKYDTLALTALTSISPGPMLFADGFEGGDLGAWSGPGKN